jgi:hypothetical protein
MTPETARAILQRHTAPPTEGAGEPGLLGRLRPYRGLRDEDFREIMDALSALAPDLRRGKVERELVADLWDLIFLPWLWALAPGGMLQRSHQISAEEQAKLAKWLEEIGLTVSLMLGATEEQGTSDEE